MQNTLVPKGGIRFSSGMYFGMSTLSLLRARYLVIVRSTASRKCTAIFGFATGDIERSSWYEMWAAVAAINELCVKKGKAGAAFRLGESILSFALI